MTVTGGFIEQCEQEQLHLSRIQSHGALLVACGANIISHASANITDWLPDNQGISVGRPLPDSLSALAQQLKPEPGNRLRFVNAPLDDCHCSMILTRSKDQSVVFELPVEGDPEQAPAGRLHISGVRQKRRDPAGTVAVNRKGAPGQRIRSRSVLTFPAGWNRRGTGRICRACRTGAISGPEIPRQRYSENRPGPVPAVALAHHPRRPCRQHRDLWA